MYFIVRDKPSMSHLSPEERRIASDAWDKANSMSLREAAAERRKIIKRIRFEDLAERTDLVRKSIAAAQATRRSMEKRING